jgi:hypothetical protein
MDPHKIADYASTAAGGGVGLSLLATVRWEQVPQGELLKALIAVGLIVGGAWMYRPRTAPPTDSGGGTDAQ